MSIDIDFRGDLDLEAGSMFSLSWTLPYGAAANPDEWMPGQGFTLDAWSVRWRAELVSAGTDRADDGRVRILATLRICETTPIGYGARPGEVVTAAPDRA